MDREDILLGIMIVGGAALFLMIAFMVGVPIDHPMQHPPAPAR